MDAASVLNILLPAVFVVVGIALVVLLIELVRTLKSARKMITQLQPTLENVEKITKELGPAMERVDPLVERVSLTVDAANLELMRVDQILENVGEISGTVNNATTAIDSVTQAPIKVVNSVTEKVRKVISPSRASKESARLAESDASLGGAALSEEPAMSKDFSPEAIPAANDAVAQDVEFALETEGEAAGDESALSENTQHYYTYATPAASVATKVAIPDNVPEVSNDYTVSIDPSFEAQATGEIPVVETAEAETVYEAAEAPVVEESDEAVVAEEVVEEAVNEALEETGIEEAVPTESRPEPAVSTPVDFSDLFDERPAEVDIAPGATDVNIAALDGLMENITASAGEAVSAAPFTVAGAEASAGQALDAPIDQVLDAPVQEDPASIADQLAASFAADAQGVAENAAEEASGFVEAPADAVSAFAAGSALEVGLSSGADVPTGASDTPLSGNVQDAVDAALAAAKARVAAKVAEELAGGEATPPSGEVEQ